MKYILSILLCVNLYAFQAQTASDHAEKASAERLAGNSKEALKQIEKAIEIAPRNANFECTRGEILLDLGDGEGAFKSFTRAIQLDPHHAKAYNNRAILVEMAGLFKEALEDYGRAIDYAVSDTMMYDFITHRAVTKTKMRNFKEAYADLMLSYKFDSTNVVTLNNLAMVCDEMGQNELALEYLFRVAKLDPSLNAVNTNIGFIYQKIGDHKEAIVYFNKHIANDPNDPYGYNNRAYSKLQLKDIKGAMEDVEKSIKIFPGNSYAYRNRALIYLAQEKNKKACADLKLAVEKGFTEQYGPEVEELLKKECK